jgi:hypothetical protein
MRCRERGAHETTQHHLLLRGGGRRSCRARERRRQGKASQCQAVFSATLSGSQVTIWETHDPRDPNDPCDGGFHNYGDQTIKFNIPGKFKLTAHDVSSDRTSSATTAGRP